MINEKIENAINEQINAEFWSAYLYLSMSVYCSHEGLSGAANWFDIQFKEEQDHARKFIRYILSRGGKVTLLPIEKVETEWKSLLDAFKDTLKHERVVTQKINDIYTLAIKENDYATQSFLNWYIDEQIEEEETAQNMIDALKMIGDGYGLYQFDKELATRTYTPLAEE
ncbi:MAG: ferritin [Bacteroidales bacterium]|jgi:ferritin|nr:ferritin [Bacteroidales bacterium]